MTDKVSREVRSKTMQAVKSKNTKLEEKVITELWKRGVRFRRNVQNLEGKPDIGIKKRKVAIFIDSCFWHGCGLHCRMPESNKDYWIRKIERNKRRDGQINNLYKGNQWKLLRVWEHDIKNKFDETITRIIKFIRDENEGRTLN